MKRSIFLVLALAGCGGVVCGPGTDEVNGVCVPSEPPAAAPAPVAPAPVAPAPVAPPPIPVLALEPGDLVEPPRPAASALHVLVAADGSVTIDGEPISDAALDERARAYLAEHPADGSVVVESHPDAPHAGVVALFDRLSRAGITHLSIRTTPR